MMRLALPVVVVQVGMMLIGVVDTMVVGRLSSEALAAVALGHVAVVAVSSFGVGMLLALDPLVAQAVGAGDEVVVRRSVQRGMVLAIGLMVPTTLLLMPVETVLTILRQPPETVPIAAAYVRICIPGLLPFYGFVVLRQSLQAMGRLRPIVITIIAVNLFNLIADWALVFGAGPIPRLGPIGSAWATTAARTLLFVMRRPASATAVANGSPRYTDRFSGPARDGGVCGHCPPDGRARHIADGGPPGHHQSRLADLHGAAGRLLGGRSSGRQGHRCR
jgi:MATE family multidrug resistance protein